MHERRERSFAASSARGDSRNGCLERVDPQTNRRVSDVLRLPRHDERHQLGAAVHTHTDDDSLSPFAGSGSSDLVLVNLHVVDAWSLIELNIHEDVVLVVICVML